MGSLSVGATQTVLATTMVVNVVAPAECFFLNEVDEEQWVLIGSIVASFFERGQSCYAECSDSCSPYRTTTCRVVFKNRFADSDDPCSVTCRSKRPSRLKQQQLTSRSTVVVNPRTPNPTAPRANQRSHRQPHNEAGSSSGSSRASTSRQPVRTTTRR